MKIFKIFPTNIYVLNLSCLNICLKTNERLHKRVAWVFSMFPWVESYFKALTRKFEGFYEWSEPNPTRNWKDLNDLNPTRPEIGKIFKPLTQKNPRFKAIVTRTSNFKARIGNSNRYSIFLNNFDICIENQTQDIQSS